MIAFAKYGLLGLYLIAVYGLSYVGMRKTKSLAGFAVGNHDMGPVLVGVVMASSIASTATFVFNPGFVYTHGMAAFLHYAVAAQLGIAVGLVAVTKGFRRLGAENGCLTIPDWIRARYGSDRLALFFASINLLSIAFVVLIMVGCALLVQQLIGWSYVVSLAAVLIVVFSYVLMGGTYAHAYTNAVQGVLMAVVAVALFASGWSLWSGGLLEGLAQVSAAYAAPINPQSELYGSVMGVFISAFVVTFALMMQPHILTKVLYLRAQRDVRRFLVTSIGAGAVFSLVLFVGFYARLRGMEFAVAEQDQVVTQYVGVAFGGSIAGQLMTTFVLVALLSAGMSTLDGILVSLSAIVTHDLYLRRNGADADPKRGLALSRWVLVGVGLVAFALALQPPKVVGLFAQKGVYGLAAASFVPVVFGVILRGKIPASIMGIAAVTALSIHVVLHFVAGVANPAVSSCYAIVASVVVAVALIGLHRRRAVVTQMAHGVAHVQGRATGSPLTVTKG